MLSTPPAFILSQDQTLVKSLILNQNNVSYFNPFSLSTLLFVWKSYFNKMFAPISRFWKFVRNFQGWFIIQLSMFFTSCSFEHRAQHLFRDDWMHTASPAPISKSCLFQVKINSWLIYPFYCFLRIFRSFVFMILKRTFEECVSLFSYQRSVLHCRLSQTALLLYHVVSCLSRTFFNFFEVVFVSLLQQLW